SVGRLRRSQTHWETILGSMSGSQQNDLVTPKPSFITHGGVNGIYEAIYHGIPIVGLPTFVNQPDNIAHMTAKGAAIRWT
ncbi:UDP-glucuronosyltransferase 2B10, partial [Camelus dromedarius]